MVYLFLSVVGVLSMVHVKDSQGVPQQLLLGMAREQEWPPLEGAKKNPTTIVDRSDEIQARKDAFVVDMAQLAAQALKPILTLSKPSFPTWIDEPLDGEETQVPHPSGTVHSMDELVRVFDEAEPGALVTMGFHFTLKDLEALTRLSYQTSLVYWEDQFYLVRGDARGVLLPSEGAYSLFTSQPQADPKKLLSFYLDYDPEIGQYEVLLHQLGLVIYAGTGYSADSLIPYQTALLGSLEQGSPLLASVMAYQAWYKLHAIPFLFLQWNLLEKWYEAQTLEAKPVALNWPTDDFILTREVHQLRHFDPQYKNTTGQMSLVGLLPVQENEEPSDSLMVRNADHSWFQKVGQAVRGWFTGQKNLAVLGEATDVFGYDCHTPHVLPGVTPLNDSLADPVLSPLSPQLPGVMRPGVNFLKG